MIITMKVTSLACSVYDGTHRKEEDLNNDQKILAIRFLLNSQFLSSIEFKFRDK